MKVRVLPPALNDLVLAGEFYERQESGLAEYFFDNISTEVDSLVIYAGIHSQRFGFHRLLSERFPYAIYYRVVAGEVLVFRILDCRRDPRKIRSALKKLG